MPSQEATRKVLMIGPALSQRGGIASVETVYLRSWDRARIDLRHVATYTSHYNSKAKKLGIALWAFMCAAWQMLFWEPDVIHIHFSWRGSCYRKSAFVVLAQLFVHPKLVLHCHAGEFDCFYHNTPRPLRAYIRWVLARSDKLIVLSVKQKRFFESLVSGLSIDVLPNPVYCPPAVTSQRQRMVLTLGELGARKGTYDILESIPAILDRCPDLEFWLAGDGDVEPVKAIVATKPWKNQIRIPGWIGMEAKRQFLEKALLFLLPSHDEGLPVALLEAMAYGVPIVSTPVGGIPELITNERDGLLVKPGAISEIVSAVTRLCEDADLRTALAESARSRVLERCEASAIVEQLYELYDSVLLPKTDNLRQESEPLGQEHV